MLEVTLDVCGQWRCSLVCEPAITWRCFCDLVTKETGITWGMYHLSLYGDELKFYGHDVINFTGGELIRVDMCEIIRLASRNVEKFLHPLHLAAESGNTIAIQRWLASGVDVNILDYKKRTPLHYAAPYARIHSVAAIELLLQSGADVTVVDDSGQKALNKVCYYQPGSTETVRVLIAAEEVAARDEIELHQKTLRLKFS
jgi:hypothetical protein